MFLLLWTLVLVGSLGLTFFTSTEPTTQSLWQEMLSSTSPWSSQVAVVFFDDYGHPDVKRAVDMGLNAFASFEFAMFTGWQLVGKVAEVASTTVLATLD